MNYINNFNLKLLFINNIIIAIQLIQTFLFQSNYVYWLNKTSQETGKTANVPYNNCYSSVQYILSACKYLYTIEYNMRLDVARYV